VIINDIEIERLCREQAMILPFSPDQLNPASYDVRLGAEIMIESVATRDFIRAPLDGYTKENPWMLRPGQFCLGCTQEILNMPEDIAGTFALKSSRGREGYSHALSAFIDPGFYGSRLTLELHNIRQVHPIPLYPGMLIGQIVFQRMEAAPRVSYAVKGHYNLNQTVMPSVWQQSHATEEFDRIAA
jgi:dCTP deaminase